MHIHVYYSDITYNYVIYTYIPYINIIVLDVDCTFGQVRCHLFVCLVQVGDPEATADMLIQKLKLLCPQSSRRVGLLNEPQKIR